MAKGGKLTKIKSVLKKMQSFKLGRSASSIAAANTSSDDDSYDAASSTKDLHPVYVGKSRRRYLITSDVLDNPLFRELVERRSDDEESITVGCEVVMFEHLLWMLENADPQPESLDELVEFYACWRRGGAREVNTVCDLKVESNAIRGPIVCGRRLHILVYSCILVFFVFWEFSFFSSNVNNVMISGVEYILLKESEIDGED